MRCGCASQACTCVVVGGHGTEVTGTGSETNPYIISTDGPDQSDFDDLVAYVNTLPTREEFDALEDRVAALEGGGGGGPPGDGPIQVIGFEEGNDGDVIARVDNPLYVDIQGSPKYAFAAALHGDYGAYISPTSAGTIKVDAQSGLADDYQFYIHPNVRGDDPAPILRFSTAASGLPGGAVGIRAGGSLAIYDAWDLLNAVDSTDKALNDGEWSRVDVRSIYNPNLGVQTIHVRLFKNDEEGDTPADEVTASFNADMPDEVLLGFDSSFATWDVYLDTYRFKSGVEFWIPALVPSLPNLIHTYEALADGPFALGVLGAEDAVGFTGTVAFKASAAIHGSRGISTSPGGVSYAIQNRDEEFGSVYFTMLTGGGSRTPLIQFLNGGAGGTVQGMIRLRTARSVDIAEDNAVTGSGTTGHSVTVGQAARLDWHTQWDSINGLRIALHLFFNDPESRDDFEPITNYTIAAALQPDTVLIGSVGTGWSVNFDTHRTFPQTDNFNDIPPYAPHTIDVNGTFLQAGDATQTTAEIAGYAKTGSYTSLKLRVSTSPILGGATLYAAAPSNVYGWSRWSLTGLAPDTVYYLQMADYDGVTTTGYGELIHFRTLQPALAALTHDLVICASSCQDAPTSWAGAFEHAAAQGFDRFLHLGDNGYPDLNTDITKHLTNFAKQNVWIGRKAIQAIGAVDQITSDHDTNGGQHNGVGNGPNFNDPTTKVNITAAQQAIPQRFEDVRSPKHGKYRSEVEGPIMFIKIDQRSTDRTDMVLNKAQPTDWSLATMLGATQLAWWKAQIDYASTNGLFVVQFQDSAWNGISPSPIPVSYSDKWPSYRYERDLMSDYAAAAGVNMLIVHGDSHALQQDDGTNDNAAAQSDKNGYAVLCAGPLGQDSHAHFQDSYTYTWPTGLGEGGGGSHPVSNQYYRIVFHMEDSDHLRVTATPWDVTKDRVGTPMIPYAPFTRVYPLLTGSGMIPPWVVP